MGSTGDMKEKVSIFWFFTFFAILHSDLTIFFTKMQKLEN